MTSQSAGTQQKLIRAAMAVLLAAAGGFALTRNIPFRAFPEEYFTCLGLFRIAVGLLILLRLKRSEKALPMLWGWHHTESLTILWRLWYVVILCLVAGLMTPGMTALHFILTWIVFRKSFYYSIEDIYFQITAFHLIFLNTGAQLSLDRYFGFHFWLSPERPVLALNLFVWCMALTMFSAGLEKVFSEVWRRGLGFYYFVGLPHLVRKKFEFLRRKKTLCMLLAYGSMLAEMALLPSLFAEGLRIIVLILLLLFSLGLMIFVDLSFIGQVVGLILSLFLSLDLVQSMVATPIQPSASVAWVAPAVGLWFVWVLRVMWTGTQLSPPEILARWTTGVQPVRVFTEVHLFGVYIYRLITGEGAVRFEAFREDGGPGEYQQWYPRYFQGAMYPVTDACAAYRAGNPKPPQLDRILDLCYAALCSSSAKAPQSGTILLQVRVVNPETRYAPETGHWLSPEWITVGSCTLSEGTPAWEWREKPPKAHRSYRTIFLKA